MVLPNLVVKAGDVDINVLDNEEGLSVILRGVLERDIKVDTSRAELNVQETRVLELDPSALLAEPVGNVGRRDVEALDPHSDGAVVLGRISGIALRELKVVVGDESDRVGNERSRLQVEVVNHQIDILALELNSRDGDLFDETDDTGHHDIDKVPVETVAVGFQAVEAHLAGIGHVFAHGLNCVDQVGGEFIVGERVEEGFKFLLQGRGVGLPVGVVPQEGLAVIVEGGSLSVGVLGDDV